MSIDPMHLPIFGDPRPVAPPRAVRAASALLMVQAAVTVAALAHTAVRLPEFDLSLFLVPLALTVWFALSVRGGRPWARPAAVVAVALGAVMSLALPAGYLAFAASAVLLTLAARLMYRPDVTPYFTADPSA